MREVIMKVYSVEELSEKALGNAYYDWCAYSGYPWGCDNEKTMKEFEKIFPIKVTDWEYGGGYKYVEFHMTCDDEVADLEGFRLAKYIWNNYRTDLYNGKYYSRVRYVDGKYQYASRRSKIILEKNCPLTGYYLDYVILKPIWNFLDNPEPNVTFKDLMKECLERWINACSTDYDSYYSIGNFKEMAKDNGWLFFENGSKF